MSLGYVRMINENIFKDIGIEISFHESSDFLKIKETLTRIGVTSAATFTLHQSCHILHKRDSHGTSRYAIVHFKEMFKLDGKPSSLDIKDIIRRNYIIKLLREWNLLKVVDGEKLSKTDDRLREVGDSIKIVKYGEKAKWNLKTKYAIGK